MSIKPGFVYVVGPLESCYKIGHSVDPGERLRSYAPLLPVEVRILHQIESFNRVWLENYLHQRFASRRVRGEWFRLSSSDLDYLAGITVADTPYDLPDDDVAIALSHAEAYFREPLDDHNKWGKRITVCLDYDTYGASLVCLHRWTATMFAYSEEGMVKHDVSRGLRRKVYRREMAPNCTSPSLVPLDVFRWAQFFQHDEVGTIVDGLDLNDQQKSAAINALKALGGPPTPGWLPFLGVIPV